MKPDMRWAVVPLHSKQERIEFRYNRHLLSRRVHAGELCLEDYRSSVIDFLADNLTDKHGDQAENYCWMAYTIASHLLVFGKYAEAQAFCSDLKRFLREVDLDRELYVNTILSGPNQENSWYWEIFNYKANRFMALGHQHECLRRSKYDCWINDHIKCLDEIVLTGHRECENSRGEWEPAVNSDHYKKFWTESLSDVMRGFFRVWVAHRLSYDIEFSPIPFRYYVNQFNNAVSVLNETPDGLGTLNRMKDTIFKVQLMAFADPRTVLNDIQDLVLLQNPKTSVRKTDEFSLRETAYVAEYIENGETDRGNLDRVKADIESADLLGLTNCSNNLNNIRLLFDRGNYRV